MVRIFSKFSDIKKYFSNNKNEIRINTKNSWLFFHFNRLSFVIKFIKMSFLNFFKTDKENKYSQSGQDQFAYNISGSNGLYLEIGAHHPIINSNTFILEKLCNWKGISIEYDISFKEMWDNSKDRNNKISWEDAFNIDYTN